jgi:cytochrome c oxidase subunit 3
MNTTAILKAPDRAGDERSLPRFDGSSGGHGAQASAGSVALWVFIGVATSLFTLFITAYIMRMNIDDWSPIAMPWQLWLSTALLVAGSVLMQLAAAPTASMRPLMLAGGVCALAFLGVQLWAWQALLGMRVVPAGNPAASFFYLLTAMHGLHVIGGVAAWTWTARHIRTMEATDARRRIGLCARYWHFLLAVWIVLYATFTGITPELVAYICGR